MEKKFILAPVVEEILKDRVGTILEHPEDEQDLLREELEACQATLATGVINDFAEDVLEEYGNHRYGWEHAARRINRDLALQGRLERWDPTSEFSGAAPKTCIVRGVKYHAAICHND